MSSDIRDTTMRVPGRWQVVVPRGGRGRDEVGAASAVAVLVFPALLLAIMLIVQFSLYLHAASVAEAAAQDAAAAARQAHGSEVAARAAAGQALGTLGPRMLSGTNVVVQRGPATARVVVTGQVASLVPGLSLRVRESAEGPVERYVPPPPASAALGEPR